MFWVRRVRLSRDIRLASLWARRALFFLRARYAHSLDRARMHSLIQPETKRTAPWATESATSNSSCWEIRPSGSPVWLSDSSETNSLNFRSRPLEVGSDRHLVRRGAMTGWVVLGYGCMIEEIYPHDNIHHLYPYIAQSAHWDNFFIDIAFGGKRRG